MDIKQKLDAIQQHAKVSSEKFIIVVTLNYFRAHKRPKYEVSIMRGDGDAVVLYSNHDWDIAKEQARFYAEWFNCPMQYALPDSPA